MADCVRCMMGLIIIFAVWGGVLVFGGSWVTATTLAITTCVAVVVASSAYWVYKEYQFETRVWALEDEIVEPTVLGVSEVIGVGSQVVMGIPVGTNMQNTVAGVATYPEFVMGRVSAGHDQGLRGAGRA